MIPKYLKLLNAFLTEPKQSTGLYPLRKFYRDPDKYKTRGVKPEEHNARDKAPQSTWVNFNFYQVPEDTYGVPLLSERCHQKILGG